MGNDSSDNKSREELLAENQRLRQRLAQLEQGADSALLRSQSQLHTIIDNLPFDFLMLDRDGRYSLQNKVCMRDWGDLIGLRPEDLEMPAGTLAAWQENNRRAFAGETVLGEISVDLAGTERHYYNVIAPITNGDEIEGILCMNMDITERRELETARQRLSRVDSVNVLAGGIAHDFNNVINGIMGNLTLALAELNESDPATRFLLGAQAACERAASLTEHLLTFARGGPPKREISQLGPLLEDTLKFALHGSKCLYQLSIAPDLLPAFVDRGQIAQVIQNLAINAAQAMPDGGQVEMLVKNVQLSHDHPGGLASGDYISITMVDSGPGMDSQVAEHIFDPYFTTKSEGHGLGLAVVHSIVQNHGGLVQVSSAPGQGTTFEVLIKATREQSIVQNTETQPGDAP